MGGKEKTRRIAVIFFLQTLSCKELSSEIPRWVSPVMESLCGSDGSPEAALPVNQSFLQQCTGAAASATAAAGAVNGSEWIHVKFLSYSGFDLLLQGCHCSR